MALSVKQGEIQRLIRFYRQTIKELAEDFVGALDFERPRIFTQIKGALRSLDDLDDKTAAWGRKNIAKLYAAASKEAGAELSRIGLSKSEVDRAQQFSVINRQAIEALMVDPEVGFLSSMKDATNQVRSRIRTIQNQAKLLRAQQGVFDATIARVGILQGASVNEVRDRLVNEMVSLKNSSELSFTRRARGLPTGHIVKSTADLPYIKIPDRRAAAGFRRLRVDKYAEMLGRTKMAQAANLARRQKALEHDVPLIQISANKPLHDDACFLYIGKVFALTEAGKAEYGVPMVTELPNGGAPFHPNCTHQELIFVPEFRTPEETELAMTVPPEWALNRPWSVVQKEFERRKRGGSSAKQLAGKSANLSRSTGGRDRRREEAGLPPDTDQPRGPPKFQQNLPKVKRRDTTTRPPPSELKKGPAPLTFNLPVSLDSTNIAGPWAKALRSDRVRKDMEGILRDLTSDLRDTTGAKGVKLFKPGDDLLISVEGTEKAAKEIASGAAFTFGQDTVYGIKLLKAGSKAAKGKAQAVVMKLKRGLSAKEKAVLSRSGGFNPLEFEVIPGNRILFKAVDQEAVDLLQKRALRGLEQATGTVVDDLVDSVTEAPIKEWYTERVSQVVKRNQKLHDPIREARRKIRLRLRKAVIDGDIIDDTNIKFGDGFTLDEILKPTTLAKDLVEKGVKSLDDIQAIGAALREEVEKFTKPLRKKVADLLKEAESISQERLAINRILWQRRRDEVEAFRDELKRQNLTIPEKAKRVSEFTRGQPVSGEGGSDLDLRYKALQERTTGIFTERDKTLGKLEKVMRDETLRALSEVRSMGPGAIKQNFAATTPEKWKKIHEDIQQYFPTTWLEASRDLRRVDRFRIVGLGEYEASARGLHTFRTMEEAVEFAKTNVAPVGKFRVEAEAPELERLYVGPVKGMSKGMPGYYRRGYGQGDIAEIAISKNNTEPVSTVLHEQMHRIEDAMKKIREAEGEFYRMRTTNPKTGKQERGRKKIKGLPTGGRYRDDKFYVEGKKGSLHTRYLGRDYETGPDGYWEIMTMGSEGVFGFDREVTKLILEDAELYNFILGVLAGL